ncbi:MAG: hypothetical protein ACOYKE_05965 [Ferruginibacter sp.]
MNNESVSNFLYLKMKLYVNAQKKKDLSNKDTFVIIFAASIS